MSNLLDRLVDGMPWLDAAAEKLKTLGDPVLGPDAPVPVKDALYGVWLDHPLHPPLTDIPIGAWSLTALFDLMGQERAADVSLKVGVAGAVGSAVTGLAQWHDLQNMEKPRRIGVLHAGLNTVALSFYLASWAARSNGSRGVGVATAMAGYGISGVSAWIGGDLAFRLGIGVSRVAFQNPPSKWTDVVPVSKVPEGELVRVEVKKGLPVVILREGDMIYAASSTCTHVGGPLHKGHRDGTCVTCPWHGSQFDLRDGRVVHGPATAPLDAFEGRVVEGQVQLRSVSG